MSSVNENKGRCSASVRLKVTVYDKDGNVVEEIEKEGDIFTRGWLAFMASMLKQLINSASTLTYTAKDITGTDRSLGGTSSGSEMYRSPGISMSIWNTLAIVIGRGTTPPSVDNYSLDIPTGDSAIPSVPTVSIDASTGKMYLGISAIIYPATTPVTISEAGIRVSLYDAGLTLRTFLITRDTFTPVNVPSGGAIAISYTFVFN